MDVILLFFSTNFHIHQKRTSAAFTSANTSVSVEQGKQEQIWDAESGFFNSFYLFLFILLKFFSEHYTFFYSTFSA